MRKYYVIIYFLLNITMLAQSNSENSFWAQIGGGANFSDFSDSNLGSNLCLSLNYKFQNNVITVSYLNSEFFSFDNPNESIKSYQLKYGISSDFSMRGLIFPFPLFLLVKKDFNYSIIGRIGLSYNRGIKRTTLITDDFFGDSYNSLYVDGFGLPIEVELKEDITNFLGLGLSVFANINKVSNYIGFSFNLYVGKF